MIRESESRMVLSRHAALKTRADGDVLVLPERAIRLSGSGGEILRLCDGERTNREIVATLQARYPGSPEIEREVERFLAEMLDFGGVACAPHTPASATPERVQ